MAVFTDLAGISSSLLSSVCASVGMQPSKAQLLCESASQPPSTGTYSMSNLTAFRYEAGPANSQKNDNWQVSRVSKDFDVNPDFVPAIFMNISPIDLYT